MFTRVWGVLLAFRYVFTNLVKYRYAEGHVFAAAAPKGGVFSENLFKATLQGEIASSRRNRLKGVFSQNLFKATLQGKTRLFKAKSPGALQGKIAWRPSRRNRLAPLRGGVVFGSNS